MIYMQDNIIKDLEIERNTTNLITEIVTKLKVRKLEGFDLVDWDNTLEKYISYTKIIHLHSESPIEKIFLGALLIGFLVSQPDYLILISPTQDVDSLMKREKRLIELYEQIEKDYLQEDRCEGPEEKPGYLKNIDAYIFNLHKEGGISIEDYQELSVDRFRFITKSVIPYYITPQVYISNVGKDKKFIRCDLFIWNPFNEKLRYIIEFDGYEWHSTNAKFTKDRIRDRDLLLQGYEVLRYSGKEINQDPMSCVKDLFKHINTGQLKDFDMNFHLGMLSDEIDKKERSGLSRNHGDCPKCGGKGHRPEFIHIEGGKCFRCGGTGYIKGSLETTRTGSSTSIDTGGSTSIDTGGSTSIDTGGSTSIDTGGSTSIDTGGSTSIGTGGSTSIGTGGSTSIDTGGSTSIDTGGSTSIDWNGIGRRNIIVITTTAIVGFLLVVWITMTLFTGGTPNTTLTQATTSILPPTSFVKTVVPSAVSASPSSDPTVAPAISNGQPVFHGTGRETTVEPSWYPCQERQIKGNKNSKIYHIPTGDFYAKTFQNVTCFNTAAEAEAAGFRAARN